MPTEIERKFLVINDDWRQQVKHSEKYIQGYFTTNAECSIRIRVYGEKACLNIKSATLGITRKEYDYPVPLADATDMLETLCNRPLLEKKRHFIQFGQHTWEVDEFTGENAGLIVAEIELTSTDENFDKPSWCGEEVSDDARYYNVCLVENPYQRWKDKK